MKTTIVLACLVSVTALAQHGPDLGKVEIEVHKLAPSLAMLEGLGGNIGISYGDDGVLVIDDEFAPLHAKIKAAIATLSKKPVRFVLNTHWHFDHMGDNANMSADGAVIVAHDNVFTRLSTAQKHPLSGAPMPAEPHAAQPVVSFDHELTFHVNGDTAHVLHVEHAHTDGDSIVFFEKGDVVHMGDTFFSNGYPLIDRSAGGTIDGMVDATARVIAMTDDKAQIIPGHGPMANRAKLVEFHDMLKAVRDKVSTMKKQHLTLEQVLAGKPTATYDAKWSGAMKNDEFVKTVYETVKN